MDQKSSKKSVKGLFKGALAAGATMLALTMGGNAYRAVQKSAEKAPESITSVQKHVDKSILERCQTIEESRIYYNDSLVRFNMTRGQQETFQSIMKESTSCLDDLIKGVEGSKGNLSVATFDDVYTRLAGKWASGLDKNNSDPILQTVLSKVMPDLKDKIEAGIKKGRTGADCLEFLKACRGYTDASDKFVQLTLETPSPSPGASIVGRGVTPVDVAGADMSVASRRVSVLQYFFETGQYMNSGMRSSSGASGPAYATVHRGRTGKPQGRLLNRSPIPGGKTPHGYGKMRKINIRSGGIRY